MGEEQLPKVQRNALCKKQRRGAEQIKDKATDPAVRAGIYPEATEASEGP